MRLNPDQSKHLASVIDKAAIAYFAVVGYTAYAKSDWMMFVHAIVAFLVIEAFALLVLSGRKESEQKHVG